MKNTTHRVVIINDVKSDIISSAILILKNSDFVCDAAALAEAEQVVEKYMQNNLRISEQKSSKKFIPLLGMMLVSLAGICLYIVLRLVK